ncbi:MAG: hypothetical protein R3212_08020 [Xanthomonadales bacterium]|nr:hypothetical protein [Xanthomonadales bacterium]
MPDRLATTAKLTRSALLLLLVSVTPAALAIEYVYEVRYSVSVKADEAWVDVQLDLDQPRDIVRELRFRVDDERYRGFEGNGTITTKGRYVRWTPTQTGGQIRWQVNVESRRGNGAFDGLMTPDWAVFRGDDLVPPVFTRSLKGGRAQARLVFDLPRDWSVITPYERNDKGEFLVVHEDRNFDRPVGWMAIGKLGVRWATVADTQVAVAGPIGQGLRRQDILAFLRWTVPTLKDIFDTTPDRLLIVGAGDPMWRGGLSGPSSLYLHADRPLISENGTSTLLHELVHVASSIRAEPGADWIVEGLAEFYALEILVRSGTTSPRRHRMSVEDVAEWGKMADDLFVSDASAEVTARAVVILQAVDEEIRTGSKATHSLDDVVRALSREGAVSYDRFRELADEYAGRTVKVLKPSRLPGDPE